MAGLVVRFRGRCPLRPPGSLLDSRPEAFAAVGGFIASSFSSRCCTATPQSMVLRAPPVKPWPVGSVRSYHKFAKPDSPNLDALRKVITEKLTPVHFYLRNNLIFTNWVYDMHFVGIICSPKFEGKSHKEMNAMVDACAEEVGMGGRVRCICQPPSRWHMMRRRSRHRWDFDR
mmetsp:Transcript_140972/g.351519  ORF Transcript_140972/g.351519 Transcript_140972/m.351519 type:complete len:173 (-) Transcript_140972:103-621(-)